MTPELAKAIRRYAKAARALAAAHDAERALIPFVAAGWVDPFVRQVANTAKAIPTDALALGRPTLSVDPAKLRALMAEGLTNKQLAERLGVSRPTLKRRLDELGIRRRAPAFSAEQRPEFTKLWNAQTPAADMAAHFGITESRVYQIQQKLKLPRRPRARSPIPAGRGAPVPRRAESGGGAGRSQGAPGPAGASTKISANRILVQAETTPKEKLAARPNMRHANAVRGAAEPEKPKALPAASHPAFWQAPVAEAIADLPDDESGSIAGVIRFLRTRDYSIVGAGEGKWRIDGRRVVDVAGLLEIANRARERMGKPPIALDRASWL